MVDNNQWFEVSKQKKYLYVIREKLENVDPRFYTIYTNIFLLLGSKSVLLIDTGCGLFPLKSIINELVAKKKLIVVNTHGHWDHVCGNAEFNEIYIHELESGVVSKPLNITNLKDSSKEIVKRYEKNNFLMPPASIIHTVKEGDTIDLGNLLVETIHTPGHSPGSISLLTDKGELFVGDSAHYGSVYLPKKKQFPVFLSSLSKLIKLFDDGKFVEIYPGHEEYPAGIELLRKLYEGVQNIENLWESKQKDDFLRSWIINDENFKYVISKI